MKPDNHTIAVLQGRGIIPGNNIMCASGDGSSGKVWPVDKWLQIGSGVVVGRDFDRCCNLYGQYTNYAQVTKRNFL